MIKNLTSGNILSGKAKKAQGFLDNALGMLLKKNSAGLIFFTNLGIHTLLMRSSIDVIIVDKNKNVVKTIKQLRPNRIALWNPRFGTVIELPSGSIEQSKTKIGDRLDF